MTEVSNVKRIAFLDNTHRDIRIAVIKRAMRRHATVLVTVEATLCGAPISSTTYRLKAGAR